ncbi:membrane protein insertion efficiency factor YidD [Tateyamaria sp. syn59]|uniref:membrane protein insertion efficiency factor YidD n=1 Tax=Tateyamaria sp. syn59 TaxID=2576942 RepID=UPI0011BFC3FD|nr:membrane protein insertion efficiency factor YidD [Tateyamaria sp. syn59]
MRVRGGHRLILSPWPGHSCRFQPSPFVYAIEALATHGPVCGLWLTLNRLERCDLWAGSGFGPMPPVTHSKSK